MTDLTDYTKRDVDTLYIIDIHEYCERTGVTLEDLVNILTKDLELLDEARLTYTDRYRDPGLSYSDGIPLIQLISSISKRIAKKELKLKRYREALEALDLSRHLKGGT